MDVFVISDDEDNIPEPPPKKQRLDTVEYVAEPVTTPEQTNPAPSENEPVEKQDVKPSPPEKVPIVSEAVVRLYTVPIVLDTAARIFENFDQVVLFDSNTLTTTVNDGKQNCHVKISFNKNTIKKATCSCTKYAILYCEHIAAILLLTSRRPNLIYHVNNLRNFMNEIDLSSAKRLLLSFVCNPKKSHHSLHKLVHEPTSANATPFDFDTLLKEHANDDRISSALPTVVVPEQEDKSNHLDMVTDYRLLAADSGSMIVSQLVKRCEIVCGKGDDLINYGDIHNGIEYKLLAGQLFALRHISNIPSTDETTFYNGLSRYAIGFEKVISQRADANTKARIYNKVREWVISDKSKKQIFKTVFHSILRATEPESQSLQAVYAGDQNAMQTFTEDSSMVYTRLHALLQETNSVQLTKAYNYCATMKQHMLAITFLLKLERTDDIFTYVLTKVDNTQIRIYVLLFFILYITRRHSNRLPEQYQLLNSHMDKLLNYPARQVNDYIADMANLIPTEKNYVNTLVHELENNPKMEKREMYIKILENVYAVYLKIMEDKNSTRAITTMILGFVKSINKVEETFRVAIGSHTSAENWIILAQCFQNKFQNTYYTIELFKKAITSTDTLKISTLSLATDVAVKLFDTNKLVVSQIVECIIARAKVEDFDVLWDFAQLSSLESFAQERFSLIMRVLHLSIERSFAKSTSIDEQALAYCWMQAYFSISTEDSLIQFASVIVRGLNVSTFTNVFKVMQNVDATVIDGVDYDKYHATVLENAGVLSRCAEELKEYSPKAALLLGELCMAIIQKRPMPKSALVLTDVSLPPTVLTGICDCGMCTHVKQFLSSQQLKISLNVPSRDVLAHLEHYVGHNRDRNREIDPLLFKYIQTKNAGSYEITKNLEPIENLATKKERAQVNSYQAEIASVIRLLVSTSIQLETIANSTEKYSQKALDYCAYISTTNVFVAIQLISILATNASYKQFVDDLSKTVAEYDYENMPTLPISTRFQLVEIAYSVGSFLRAQNLLIEIFKLDPSYACMLQIQRVRKKVEESQREALHRKREHLKMQQSRYSSDEYFKKSTQLDNIEKQQRENTFSRLSEELLDELSIKYNEAYKGKTDFKTDVLARYNYARVRDHLHLYTSFVKEKSGTKLAYFLISMYDNANVETSFDLLSYLFNLMRQYQITEDEVEIVFKSIVFQMLDSVSAQEMKKEQNAKINEWCLTIAYCNYKNFAIAVANRRTQQLIAHDKRQEVIVSWMVVFATIYAYCGQVANGTHAKEMRSILQKVQNAQLRSMLQHNPLVNPRVDNNPPPFRAFTSPYVTDVPMPQ